MGQEELKPGDRVEMTELGKTQFTPPYTGIVVTYHGIAHRIKVKREGRKTPTMYHILFWRKVRRKRGVEAK